ncbi:unnamed protein product, partial [Symbiodinium pilosum]
KRAAQDPSSLHLQQQSILQPVIAMGSVTSLCVKLSTDASGELVKQSPNAKLGLAEGEKVLKAQVYSLHHHWCEQDRWSDWYELRLLEDGTCTWWKAECGAGRLAGNRATKHDKFLMDGTYTLRTTAT